jgi:hypothetical protein
MRPGQRCENYNHGRSNTPVRYCPSCGGVVNQNLPIKKCTQDEHAVNRRERNTFCVHCGERLITGNG